MTGSIGLLGTEPSWKLSLLAQLNVLKQLGLVSFDEFPGYETTVGGEAWLLQFDE